MASDVFISMDLQINLDYLLTGDREQVSRRESLCTMPNMICRVRSSPG